MSFINFNNKENHSAGYTVEMIKEALLAIETKNQAKVESLTKGLKGTIPLSEAINLFSNKLNAMAALNFAKQNNMGQIIEENAKIAADKAAAEAKKVVESKVNEARSINKIQKEWSEVTTDMTNTVTAWKSAEGDTKSQLLDKLKELTARKKELEAELDSAVMGKDKDLELVVKESAVNESEEYVGYVELKKGKKLINSFKDLKSASLWKSKNEDDLLDDDGVEKVGIMPKTIWDSKEAKYAINEGAVKQFEMDMTDMIKDIKSGYGWIDPEFVADTWENSSDSIDFELVKGEIYKRLIAAGLLAYADDDNEEKAGKKVKSVKELGIKESLVTEANPHAKPAGLTKDETMEVAQRFADAMSKADGKKVTVNKRTLEEDSFDLDVDGEEFDGGSYNIFQNGNVMNMAVRNNPVYGKKNDSVDTIVKNMKKMSESVVTKAPLSWDTLIERINK